MAQHMQHAVSHQQTQFPREAVSGLVGLAPGRLDADYHFARQFAHFGLRLESNNVRRPLAVSKPPIDL